MPATLSITEMASALSCGSPGCPCQQENRPNEWQVHCPAHNDQSPSLGITTGSNGQPIFTCRAGCESSGVITALTEKKLWSIRTPRTTPQVVARFEYRDALGAVRFRANRLEPGYKGASKSFFLDHPGPSGQDWHTGLGPSKKSPNCSCEKVTPLLYRLPELLAASLSELIFIVEGEKHVDKLKDLGLTATCSPMGAGKWRNEYSQSLEDHTVVILPDNDGPGQNHAQQVGQSLQGTAGEVLILDLPNLPAKGDVIDWFDAGNSAADLMQLANAAPQWQPPIYTPQPPSANGSGPDWIFDTDTRNALRLVNIHGSDLLYCDRWGKWLIWDGMRWKEDVTREIYRRADDAIRDLWQEVANESDQERRKALVKWAKTSESSGSVAAMITRAMSNREVAIEATTLDADPWLLTVQNGTLDLKTGNIHPPNRSDMITKLCPVKYDPSATCPQWITFLDQVMNNNQALVSFLQRIAGYALTGDISEHIMFILFGSGSNGKTTFINTLLDILGDYGKQVPAEIFIEKRNESHPTEKADLFGARFISASETGMGRRLSEPFIKAATGGEKLRVRRMREDFWQFDPTHKIFLTTNYRPVVYGTDEGIWRRLKLVPFSVHIPDHQQDKQLPKKLATEREGILTWIVKGCLEWQQNGLQVPQEIHYSTATYRAEMDTLAVFLEDKCLIRPTAHVASGALYRVYDEWCQESGEKPMSKRLLANRLMERGFDHARIGKESTRGWSGLGLAGAEQTGPLDF